MRVGDRPSETHDLVEDLLQRKVDTIVTAGITGRSMPHPIIALLDLNNTYLRKLMQLGVVGDEDKNSAGGARSQQSWLSPTKDAQQWLVDKASAGLHDPSLRPADRCVLQRIVATCTSLMPMVAKLQENNREAFEGTLRTGADTDTNPGTSASRTRRYYTTRDWSKPLPPLDLTRREYAALSKAWELGSDTVALQTTSMLDGDIITRITEQYSTEAYAIVRQIHKEAVNVSLSTWELLAKSIGSFIDALFSRKP